MAPFLLVGILVCLASQTAQADTIGESKGPLCFFCHSVENPDDCETVVECSKHEQCYTERYISEENHEFFRLGCKAVPICKLLHDFQSSHGTTGTNCLTCCDGKYCNQNLCRNTTLDRIQCYTCNSMLTPHECETVTTCDYDEVCATEEIIDDQFEIRYNAKCKQRQACALLGEPSVVKPVGKRQDELCDQCCTKPFCNRDLCGATEVTYTVPGSTTPAPTTTAMPTSPTTPPTTRPPTSTAARAGPTCYQCSNVLHPNDCTTVQTCTFGQECFMGLYQSHFEFDLRCMDATECHNARDARNPILNFVKYERVGCCSTARCHGFIVQNPTTTTPAPTTKPTTKPTAAPTTLPTTTSSTAPTSTPTTKPTTVPTTKPTTIATSTPTPTPAMRVSTAHNTPTSKAHGTTTVHATAVSVSNSGFSTTLTTQNTSATIVSFQNTILEFFPIKSSWAEAKKVCDSRGARLVQIASAAMQDFIYTIAKTLSFVHNAIWLGIFFRQSDAKWVYGNSGVPVVYTNWAKNQPTCPLTGSLIRLCGDDCVVMDMDKSGQWEDRYCDMVNQKSAYICEYGTFGSLISTPVLHLKRGMDKASFHDSMLHL